MSQPDSNLSSGSTRGDRSSRLQLQSAGDASEHNPAHFLDFLESKVIPLLAASLEGVSKTAKCGNKFLIVHKIKIIT